MTIFNRLSLTSIAGSSFTTRKRRGKNKTNQQLWHISTLTDNTHQVIIQEQQFMALNKSACRLFFLKRLEQHYYWWCCSKFWCQQPLALPKIMFNMLHTCTYWLWHYLVFAEVRIRYPSSEKELGRCGIFLVLKKKFFTFFKWGYRWGFEMRWLIKYELTYNMHFDKMTH